MLFLVICEPRERNSCVVVGFFSCQLWLIDIFFPLWQLTVLINVSTAAASLQTPVSVSPAGAGPTVPVVSAHLPLSVSGGGCVGPSSAGYSKPKFLSPSQAEGLVDCKSTSFMLFLLAPCMYHREHCCWVGRKEGSQKGELGNLWPATLSASEGEQSLVSSAKGGHCGNAAMAV